jgi:hypothetical protein
LARSRKTVARRGLAALVQQQTMTVAPAAPALPALGLPLAAAVPVARMGLAWREPPLLLPLLLLAVRAMAHQAELVER